MGVVDHLVIEVVYGSHGLEHVVPVLTGGLLVGHFKRERRDNGLGGWLANGEIVMPHGPGRDHECNHERGRNHQAPTLPFRLLDP